jgi:hypothetical protein
MPAIPQFYEAAGPTRATLTSPEASSVIRKRRASDRHFCLEQADEVQKCPDNPQLPPAEA